MLTPAPQAGGQPLSIIPLKSEPKQSLPPQKMTFVYGGTGGHVNG